MWESQGRGSSAWLEVSFVSRRSLLSSHGCCEQAHSLKQLLTFLRLQFHPDSLARPTEECISCTKVTPCTKQTARSDRQCNSPHLALKHSKYILQSLMLCTVYSDFGPRIFPTPLNSLPLNDIRFKIQHQKSMLQERYYNI